MLPEELKRQEHVRDLADAERDWAMGKLSHVFIGQEALADVDPNWGRNIPPGLSQAAWQSVLERQVSSNPEDASLIQVD